MRKVKAAHDQEKNPAVAAERRGLSVTQFIRRCSGRSNRWMSRGDVVPMEDPVWTRNEHSLGTYSLQLLPKSKAYGEPIR
jgi:hypothetical protein